jgi:predicted Zn-dependent protease
VCCAALVVVAAGVAVFVASGRERTERRGDPDAHPAVQDASLAELAQAERLARRGDYLAALEQVDRAIALRPERVEPHLLRAELLFREHRSDEMIPSLKRAIELDPARFEAHANLAYALRYTGRLDEAEREARWCLSQRPDFVPVRRVLAEIHRDRGDLDAARDEVRRALQFDPHDLDSRLLEADLLIYEREFEAAYERLTSLLPRHPRNRRLLAALARSAQMTGRLDEAARYRAELTKARAAEAR